MPQFVCPYCRHAAVFEMTETWIYGRFSTSIGPLHVNLQKCPNPGCDGVVAAGFGLPVQVTPIRVEPRMQPNEPDSLIPDPIRRDLSEARQCASIGAWKATAAMCRRALQGACVDRGATPGKVLAAQIAGVVAADKVHGSLKDWADAIRLVGNAGAHPGGDGLETVTQEEAGDILAFTEQFLELTFVVTNRVAARLAAKKTKP